LPSPETRAERAAGDRAPAVRIALTVLAVLAVMVVGWAAYQSAEPEPTSGADSQKNGLSSSQGAAPPAEQARTVAAPETVREALDQGALFLDVRAPEEFSAGHLAGARLVDVSAPDFEAVVADLDPNRTYVVYCASGNRAGAAIETMARLGFDDLLNGGGFTELSSSGLFARMPKDRR
jgi:phage shock protein E